ncbi:hypothetical protein OIU76_008065 [Salix suchowensis]|nr:hypothetical protein OIU76_008065 [Salix suchowensis]
MWVVGASPAIDVCCDMISRSWFDLIIGMARISGPLCLGGKNHRFLIDVIFILRSLIIGNYNILLHMIQDYLSFFFFLCELFIILAIYRAFIVMAWLM